MRTETEREERETSVKTNEFMSDMCFAQTLRAKLRGALSVYVDYHVEETLRFRLGQFFVRHLPMMRLHSVVQEVLSGVIGQNSILSSSQVHGAATMLLSRCVEHCWMIALRWEDNAKWVADTSESADCPSEWPLSHMSERSIEYTTETLITYTGNEPWANLTFQAYMYCFESEFLDFLKVARKCSSPLEMAVLIGILSLSEHEDHEEVWLWDEPVAVSIAGGHHLFPQHQIGKYRVDFAIESNEHESTPVKIAVELDGHEFHERTVDQAVHDRQRDRFLVSEGWKVVRYHRKEIADDLMKVVKEIVGMSQKVT